jgi:uncharacterized membrane protein
MAKMTQNGIGLAMFGYYSGFGGIEKIKNFS